jgi:hypothetical protein
VQTAAARRSCAGRTGQSPEGCLNTELTLTQTQLLMFQGGLMMMTPARAQQADMVPAHGVMQQPGMRWVRHPKTRLRWAHREGADLRAPRVVHAPPSPQPRPPAPSPPPPSPSLLDSAMGDAPPLP